MSSSPPTQPPPPPSHDVELCEQFFIDNKRKQNVNIQVLLNAEGIHMRRRETENSATYINEQLIRMDDVIGTRCGPRLKKRERRGLNSCKRASNNVDEPDEGSKSVDGDAKVQDSSAYLYIYAYLKKNKPLRRVQTLRILRFRNYHAYDENLRAAERWHKAILLYKRGHSASESSKQLLILLNPKSGSGKGRELFQKQVAPLLREAQLQYELHITTHPNFALEFVRNHKNLLQRYNGIVVASGDGLFYEVLNGLMERVDWRTVCREMPLGIIPCGSGNGLAKSIAHHCNEPYEPKPILHATLTCVSGRPTPLDVVRVELSSRDKHFVLYSFLSIGWGLIADIDIESERLRSIGAQRFTIWAIKRLITLRSYPGKLYYLPTDRKPDPPAQTVNENLPTTKEEKPRIIAAETESLEAVAAVSHNPRNSLPIINSAEFKDLLEDEESNEELVVNELFSDAKSVNHSLNLQDRDSWHSTSSRATAYYSIAGQSMRSNRRYRQIDAANVEFEKLMPTGTIPPLKIPLSNGDGWVCEEGDFVMVHAAYTTHLASDCFFAPDSRLNDGIIYLVIIRTGIGRPQLLNFLLSMNTGTHLPTQPDPFISVVPVRAFRIEPTENHGILTVDGERVDYGPIQAEIFPGLINIFASNRQ